VCDQDASHPHGIERCPLDREACRVATLLIVHHSPSPSCRAMFEAVHDGATNDDIEGVEVVVRSALAATVPDVLAADGYVLGTTANLGYISGALKHFFDTTYYAVMDDTAKRPYGAFVHGNNDTTGAVRAIASITKGIGWRPASDPVEVIGEPGKDDLAACWELGAMLAASLTM
jgi:multimeric flavodoxin WrbA